MNLAAVLNRNEAEADLAIASFAYVTPRPARSALAA